MIFQKIFGEIPAPKFLNLPYVGLSISDTCIRCIEFRERGEGLIIKKYSEQPLAPGIVTGGEIKDQQSLGVILETLKKEMNLEYVRVSLPEEKAYLFTAKIPVVSEEDVRNNIEFNIEENVPLPASELVFDYVLLDPENAKDHLDVIVSAFPVSIVNMYAEVMNQAHIRLLSLEIESQAIARAVVPKNSLETTLIMHFSAEKVGLYVVSHRLVEFTSTVAQRNDLPDSLSSICQEVKKLYTYWHTLKKNLDKKDKQILKVVVCGESVTEEMISYISSQCGVSVEFANVWSNVLDIHNSVPSIAFSDSLRYAPAIGLALPSEILI